MKRRIGMLVGVNAMAWLAVSVGVSACGDTMEPTVINACGSVSPTCAPNANPVIGDSTGANPYCPIGNAGQAIDPQTGLVIGGCNTIEGCYVACVYADFQKCDCGVTQVTGSGWMCAQCPSNNGDRRCGVTATVIETYQDGNWIAADCPPDQVCAGMQPDAKCEPDCSATDEVWCDGKCRDTLNDPEKCGPTCETASPCTTADPNAEAYCNTGDCQWKCNAGYKAETDAGPCVPDCASYPGTKWCDGKCRDTLSDPLMCGPNCVTAKPCPDNVPNAVPVCKNGDCQWECEPGYEPETSNGPCVSDCATFPGTEWCNGKCRNTLTDPTWCGVTCETGVTCAASDPNASAVCSNGVCSAVCDPGMTNCSGNCTDIDSDWRNCGACGNQCPNTNGVAGCVQGQCTSTCNDGFIHCPQEPPGGGCETNMFTTTKYCVIKDSQGTNQCYAAGQANPDGSASACNPSMNNQGWTALWPSGTDGPLIVNAANSPMDITPNKFHNFTECRIEADGVLRLSGPTIIGCSGNFVLDGRIAANTDVKRTTSVSVQVPDDFGKPGATISFSVTAAAGGDGAQSDNGGAGGLSKEGNGGGGGGGKNFASVGGEKGYDAESTKGGNGGKGGYACGDGNPGPGGSVPGNPGIAGGGTHCPQYEASGGGGGGGGARGANGQFLWIKVGGNMLGQGTIDIGGTNGGAGGPGGNAWAPYACGVGSGGGGGGGGGGSGGTVFLYHRGTAPQNWNINLSPGLGGTGGAGGRNHIMSQPCSPPAPAGKPGQPGQAGQKFVYSWGTPGAPTCSDGIQNQGEAGIDCGGPCPSPCGGGCITLNVGSLATYDNNYLYASFTPAVGGTLDDWLWIESWEMGTYKQSPGTFLLSAPPDNQYATCNHCVRVSQDCDTTGCSKHYFQESGIITLTNAPSPPNGHSAGSLSNVKLVEVTFDPNTLVSTPVPNGQCLLIPSASWNL